MNEPIISRATIAEKARQAFARAVPRDGHEFNWHSTDAIATWQAAWDECNGKLRHMVVDHSSDVTNMVGAEVSPP